MVFSLKWFFFSKIGSEVVLWGSKPGICYNPYEKIM